MDGKSSDAAKRRSVGILSDPKSLRDCLGIELELSVGGFSLALTVIQAPDVDKEDPGPDGQDCEEDEALSV